MADNAILMGYVGDENGCAPTLSEISLDIDEAQKIFDSVLRNIEIMLSNKKIHGDLSAYNIMYWDGEITLIDFPQVISPIVNRNAFRIFQRDITRVCEYFIKQGLQLSPEKIALDFWIRHGYNPEPELDVRYLEPENPDDVALWKKRMG